MTDVKDDLVEDNLDTLEKFGQTFQTKAIACLLTDKPFLEQTLDIVVPHYFESEANKWIVQVILNYYQQYRALPTLEVFVKEVDKFDENNAQQKVLRVAVIDQLKGVFIESKATDLQYFKNEFLEFCKNQAIKNAILKSAELVQKGKYPEIKGIMDRSLRAGQERNLGHDWKIELVDRVTQVARNTVPTGWAVIDELLDGGLGAGELGCILAPSGAGKSWVLRAIAAHALKCGLRVADYTFELSQNYVGLRYDTIFTGIESKEIRNNVHKVRATLDTIPGELMIKYFPTRTATVNHLHAHLNRMIQMDKKPDLVIIDYADLMRSIEKTSARHEELGYIYEEIRGTLGEFGIPGWTASQVQRAGMQDEVIEADKIAGAYSKIFACDFIMSVSRKLADKMSHTARAHVIKNRSGADGMTLPALMDLEHGKIQIYAENSPEGEAIKKKSSNGVETVNRMLRQKLTDINALNKLIEPELV